MSRRESRRTRASERDCFVSLRVSWRALISVSETIGLRVARSSSLAIWAFRVCSASSWAASVGFLLARVATAFAASNIFGKRSRRKASWATILRESPGWRSAAGGALVWGVPL